MSYQRAEFCYCHFALCSSRFRSVRPNSDLFHWHTLYVPFRSADRKKQRKRACERTNKQREIQSWSLIHSVTNTFPCSFFINFTNLTWLPVFFFLLLWFWQSWFYRRFRWSLSSNVPIHKTSYQFDAFSNHLLRYIEEYY